MERAIGALVDGLIEGKTVEPFDAFRLLQLAGAESDIVGTALRVLDRLRSHDGAARQNLVILIRELSGWILRDLPATTRLASAQKVLAWAREHGLSSIAGVPELERLSTYATSVQADGAGADVSNPERRDQERERLPTFSGRPSRLWAYLTELASKVSSDDEIARQITLSASKVTPGDRIAFLAALVGVPGDHDIVRWHSEGLVTALRTIVVEWHTSGAVRQWAAKSLPGFVERHFPALVAYEQTARVTLEQLFSLPAVDEPATLLLGGLAGSLEKLDAAQLFGIADALSTVLEDDEILDVLRWSIDRLSDVSAFGATPRLPTDVDGMVAEFLFSLFGSVDKRKRWRAAHVARKLLGRNRRDLADACVFRPS
jgi:hypothetical protein